MFGMSDPNQTLSQMIRYFEEERHEMVEVMASEFTSMLLANKQRDGAMQTLLVKGVRILAEVLSIRGKDKLAIQATSVLLRERKKLEKILSQTAPLFFQNSHPLSRIIEPLEVCMQKQERHRKRRNSSSRRTRIRLEILLPFLPPVRLMPRKPNIANC